MAEIINFNIVGDFFRENMPYLMAEYYQHFYLFKAFDLIKTNKIRVIDAFNVTGDHGKILFLSTEGAGIYIYGNSNDKELIEALYNRALQNHYTNFEFAGPKKIIERLFELKKLPFTVVKDRIIYMTDKVLPLSRKHLGKAVNSNYVDFDTLVQMTYDYGVEEWGEREGRGMDYMKNMVMQCIEEQSLIQYNMSFGIAAIAQVLNTENGKPIIGSLYTLPEKRGNGIATMLVHAVASKLLKAGFSSCGIISEAESPVTNRIFVNVGFSPVSEHLLLYCPDFGKFKQNFN